MTQKAAQLVLLDNLQLLERSLSWLKRSYDICKKSGVKNSYSDEEYDAFETLVSRFGRMTDLIISKVFRSIDKLELEEGGTLIDAVNRAEKRGIVESIDQIRLLKDLRNTIVHEYKEEDLLEIFRQVMEMTPILFRISDSVEDYCKKYK